MHKQTCHCGGCKSCRHAQGEPTRMCPVCHGDRSLMNSDETKQVPCKRCGTDGWIIDDRNSTDEAEVGEG